MVQYRFALNKAVGKPAEYAMSKTEAEGFRDRLRDEIRAGRLNKDGTPKQSEPSAHEPQPTLDVVAEPYLEQYVRIPTRVRMPASSSRCTSACFETPSSKALPASPCALAINRSRRFGVPTSMPCSRVVSRPSLPHEQQRTD
jgi:hypothetical protein